MKIKMHMRLTLILGVFFGVLNLNAQTSGPAYVKAALKASGVYNAPAFEYAPEFDSYNNYTKNGTIKAMFMEGLPYSKADNPDKKTKIFCWYGVPEGLTPGQKVPAVICVHGGGGEAYAVWVDKWLSKGYIAIALSLVNKLPDGTESTTYASPPQGSFFDDNDQPIQDQWFYHAIGDAMLAHSLLRSNTFTDQVDTAHIGVTGISWGGINNTVLAGIDERLDFAIPVYGCGFLRESPVYSKQYGRNSEAAKAFYDANWRGELYTPLHKCPMLFVDGNKDLQFTLNIFDRTYDSSASPEKYLRIEDAMGHGHAGGRAPMEIYDFADYVTGYRSNAIKPLDFTSLQIDANNEITYSFDYSDSVNQAILYYCEDTLVWAKDDIIWKTQTATLQTTDISGTVTTTVPDDAQVYYVNVNNTSTGSMFSSTLKYARGKPTENVSVTGVSVSPASADIISLGMTKQLNATVFPTNASNAKVVWNSTDDDVATVSQTGLVTATGKGVATITAKTDDGNFTNNCIIASLDEPIPEPEITGEFHISKSTFCLYAGNDNRITGDPVTLQTLVQGDESMTWVEHLRADGYYFYQLKGTNFCMDAGDGGANNQPVVISAFNSENKNQHWSKELISEGVYRLIKRDVEFAINSGGGIEDGKEINLWKTATTSANLHWTFTDAKGQDTGINEVDSKGVSIYPNPASDFLKIETTLEMSRVDVNSVEGQLLLSQKVSGSTHKLKLPVYEQSMLFVQIGFMDGSEITRKIMVNLVGSN